MARISELGRLVRQLQSEGYTPEEIARAVHLLGPAAKALSRADRALQEAASGAAAELGQTKAQLAAVERRLKKIQRKARKSRRKLGAALKRETRPKQRRGTKSMRELSPSYRKRLKRGLRAGKTRQEAGGHGPKSHDILQQVRKMRGPIHIRWENVTIIISEKEIRNRTVQTTISREKLAEFREHNTIPALWEATMDTWYPGADLVTYKSIHVRQE